MYINCVWEYGALYCRLVSTCCVTAVPCHRIKLPASCHTGSCILSVICNPQDITGIPQYCKLTGHVETSHFLQGTTINDLGGRQWWANPAMLNPNPDQLYLQFQIHSFKKLKWQLYQAGKGNKKIYKSGPPIIFNGRPLKVSHQVPL